MNSCDNVFGCHIKEQVCFDEFQSLVDERRRINRDDGTHLPRRVCERLLCAYTPQLFARSTTERTPRRRQHEVGDLGTPRHNRRGQTTLVHARGQGLSDRRMFGVHGDDLPRETHGILHKGAANDERLLVRQRQTSTALQSRKRRR